MTSIQQSPASGSRANTGRIAGTWAGLITGAEAGTAGIPIPVLGTFLGAVVGAVVGSMLGEWLGGKTDGPFRRGRTRLNLHTVAPIGGASSQVPQAPPSRDVTTSTVPAVPTQAAPPLVAEAPSVELQTPTVSGAAEGPAIAMTPMAPGPGGTTALPASIAKASPTRRRRVTKASSTPSLPSTATGQTPASK